MNVTIYTENDREFYPTPETLVSEMLSGIDFCYINSVLEPSAGKGNIADAINEKLKYAFHSYDKDRKNHIDCIEIDNNLRSILKEKKYNVVHDDFLTFRTHKEYDLIVMNPPFSDGEKHLLKALDLMQRGGRIVCILNAETIRNPYTNTRKLLCEKLAEYNAEVKYIEHCFLGAERKTAVTIALIRVDIESKENDSFIFDDLNKKDYSEVEESCKDLVSGDYLAQIIKQYEIEVEGGIRLIREYNAMKPKIQNSFNDKYSSPIIEMKIHGEGDYSPSKLTVNAFVEKVRYKYWYTLFTNERFVGCLTSNLRKDLMKKIDELVSYDFSAYNIGKIQEEMMAMMEKGLNDTILSLFDDLSCRWSWYPETERNVHYFNGWASNSAYKINKKVIIPINGMYSGYSWDKDTFVTQPVYEKLYDIERTLSYLDSDTLYENTLNETLKTARDIGNTKGIETQYFVLNLYKKGTCHITFKDERLLEKLNIYGSRKKGWLPPDYGKKHYKDMTKEEQTIIDDFQGVEKYEEVVAQSNYYLNDGVRRLLLQ